MTPKTPDNNGVAPKRPIGAEINVKRSSGRLVNANVIRKNSKLMQYSLRTLVIITGIAAFLLFLATSTITITKADGWGVQTVDILLADPASVSLIQFVPIRHSENAELIVNSFASADPTDIFQYIDGALLETIKTFEESIQLKIRQQWSFTETVSKGRHDYTQSFDQVVLHIRRKNGTSSQHVIELPHYCKPAKLDLTSIR